MRTLIQVQSIPPRTPPEPVEWFGPMPPIGSEMTIVGVKHEVVKYSYDAEYAMPTLMPTCDYGNCESHTGKPCARGHESPYDCPLRANPSPLGSMRCTQLTIHLKPKHREPEGDLIASLIKGQTVKQDIRFPLFSFPGRQGLAAQRQVADIERTGIPDNGITLRNQGCSGPSELWFVPLCVNLNCKNQGECICKPTIVPIHPQSHE